MNEVEMNRCSAGAQKVPAAGGGAVALLLLFPALSADALTNTATGLVYREDRGVALVTGYTGAGGHVAIPATLGGFPVGVIDRQAFQGNDSITSVTIPDSVQTIGAQAFRLCGSLASITIPNSVQTIYDEAFASCNALVSITIPDSVQDTGINVFFSCAALERVEIGTGITSIRLGTFNSCGALVSITIPDSVQSIGKGAFSGCSALASITIPDSVQSIDNGAFSFCVALEAVYFEGDAPSLGSEVFGSTPSTISYRSGTSGWGPTFGRRPTAIGSVPPQILDAEVRDGGQFGFEVQWTVGQEAVVEASDDLPGGVWSPVSTNTIPSAGSISFEEEAVLESRYYRVRSN